MACCRRFVPQVPQLIYSGYSDTPLIVTLLLGPMTVTLSGVDCNFFASHRFVHFSSTRILFKPHHNIFYD